MKPKIFLKRFNHRGQSRLAMVFDYNRNLIALIRSSMKATWSNSNGCWYVDDDEACLRNILRTFKDIADIDISGIVSSANTIQADHEEEKEMPSAPESKPLKNKKPAAHTDVQGPGMITQKIFWKKYGPVLFTIDEADDKLIIKFTGRYDPEWIKEIRSFGKAWFDTVRLEWVLNWTRLAVDSLSDYFSSRGVEVIIKKGEKPAALEENREKQGAEIRERKLDDDTMRKIETFGNYLKEKRYSDRTIETYISQLILFFKYFLPRRPEELTDEDISNFFEDYVLVNKYSSSFQNQIISGLKIFFRLNGLEVIDSSALVRPRRKKSLPKVFSKEEVQNILNSTPNAKHRLLLWMIYSCGLRRGEVTNIKMRDLDRDRGILNILEAKGKVDRFVPVSEKVWAKIDEYIMIYHPSYWLFEGQGGGKYSSESVYNVFKQALKRAGIKKDVGVHSLRHSYATHLHESGLDIRYIQELLGHKSTRTTEIYTHVSRRNLIAVRSPIEDLDLK